MIDSWLGRVVEVRVGRPGHGGFCVARHEGRVMFVRHSLPGELVNARVTEDTGKSFCRADAVEILEASPDRIVPLCPISGPGGSGCCDFSHATAEAGRQIKAAVVAEQLSRVGGIERTVEVESLGDQTGWRTRIRLGVDDEGRPGFHRLRSADIVTDLACPQAVPGMYDGLAARSWTPGADLAVAVDSDGTRHVVEIAPAVDRRVRADTGRRGASSRRAAKSGDRAHRVREGSGRAVERVGSREWTVDSWGFWQAHRAAATQYAEVVREWSGAGPGDTAWDLYAGAGTFASVVAEAVGPGGTVAAVEFSHRAVVDGRAAVTDLPQLSMQAAPVERAIGSLPPQPSVVVLDPPRSGAGRQVIAAVAGAHPNRVVHIGCDPASFARDAGLYLSHGYRLENLRAFDAFPMTSHVECIGSFVRD
ncbi:MULTISPECIES: class I SAM-dependent RNA methyltransferase [Nocardiaceae]|uniref:tRNA/tmRNA/rRNA uracil-C5-methylase (TrmA/RlmC/RlmD family) n=1 Tax=Rhodococcoides corynebacterioides TaxID=53972 RepID=A0ABS2KS44_9NOCA|nr:MULTISPECIES: TRAM domain-containing protein [Rhodococcus]MBM7414778.1 tRNA/tmRNA/rRNA uracil-C5-methylase (TrmA/RlmC/RlmD family) [Rhodococcus corynebacterioides]MBP1117240.1 tRNA/tmRNA/rRNA uracil-C5-methylase (TrmA/RlmC/RlmD family) [Rhodococcus sp. PvP016]